MPQQPPSPHFVRTGQAPTDVVVRAVSSLRSVRSAPRQHRPGPSPLYGQARLTTQAQKRRTFRAKIRPDEPRGESESESEREIERSRGTSGSVVSWTQSTDYERRATSSICQIVGRIPPPSRLSNSRDLVFDFRTYAYGRHPRRPTPPSGETAF
ncbi:hypothetical protein B2J93_3555 [Marssonina coronariae]|uniref:Uncharacterized protein n=1 Tax=Diplocarpon coronariae TaxID=2795749 RepID=A0A218Z6W5_9HELO|nr:hypothetical protein B2J93_3555 [Marssonina coronariae]